ncbi:MAG TPA: glycerophosphodiester phosphodiesterase [Ilumatobacter sp.]|nr:glycerophosphodiester phosphodiesterase [Ilumatobacter sp.]
MSLVIAHRGASRAAPENTVTAFELAARQGTDGVELDVRRTADHVLVVHHDPALPDGRTISECSAADLPASVATFDEALDACAGIFVNIEIKNDPSEPDFDATEWVAQTVVARLARRGGGPRWLISSFRVETVNRVRQLLPSVRTGWLVSEISDTVLDVCVDRGHAAVHPWVGALTKPQVIAAHGRGIAVNTWTCDEPARISELFSWGIDGVCTNVPDIALQVRASRRGT